ncbi:CopG family transcriptional regulator [Nostocoides veronense]|uniref:Antitoxin n=1 Tax=Nostocoides veronense TaxID=330836 RepID=A0ABN2LVJ3_9MICO
MRTTITLDPDVAALLEKEMKQREIGFKVAVNDAIRRGLGQSPTVDIAWPTYDLGSVRVDLDDASRMAAELEDEELLRKLAWGV